MLELAKKSWEVMVLGSFWLCHVGCANQTNSNNWRWWKSPIKVEKFVCRFLGG